MRIFVTAPDQTGTLKKSRLILVDCNTTNDLLRRICNLCNVQQQWAIVKIKQQLKNVRIIQGWPLEKYPLRQNSQIIVQIMPEGFKTQSPQISPKKLLQIDQQLELQLEDNSTTAVPDRELSFLSEQNDWTKYFQDSLAEFLNAVRSKSLATVSSILKSQPQCNDQKLLAKVMQKKIYFLLNQTGQCGRAALHWAIQEKDLDMVEFLLIKTADPNVVSIDGYTPLHLAVILKLPAIFQTLVSHPRIDLNKLTKRGTALHLAIEHSHLDYAQKLIDCGADANIENQYETTVSELCSKLKINSLKLRKLDKQRPQIPNWLKGKVYKVSSLTSRLKVRDLLVNPFQNQFILIEDGKVSQKLTISKINSVKVLKSLGLLMKKQYFYFQIDSSQMELTLAVKHSQIGIQWIQGLQKCIKYCKTKSQTVAEQDQQLVQVIDDENCTVTVHKRKKVEDKNKTKPKNGKIDKNIPDRLSLLDLKPMNENEAQNSQLPFELQSSKRSEITKQSANRKPSEQFSFDEMDDGDYLRESQLLGSVIENQFLSKSINKITNSELLITQKQKLHTVYFKDFDILRQLGHGSFGKVFLARHKKQQKLYALKVLNKKKLMAKKQMKYAVGQANILKKVDNPFIIKLHYSFQTPSNLYIALDYCPNGDLSEFLVQQESMSERICKFYIAQVILAIQYLHKQKIIYRDLKPENILIGQDGYIRLADFNLSKQNNTSSKSFCGSPAYLSPEMLQKKGVGFEADIYGIGCVFYEMLVGQPPFFDERIQVLYENIRNGKIKFPSSISKPAKNLIAHLLQRNVNKRIGVKNMNQIKKHEFFSGFEWQKLQKMQMKLPAQIQNKFSEKSQELEVITQSAFQDYDYENSASMINRIKNFTFVRQK